MMTFMRFVGKIHVCFYGSESKDCLEILVEPVINVSQENYSSERINHTVKMDMCGSVPMKIRSAILSIGESLKIAKTTRG